MSELRWDPVRREWVITATHRQERTFKPPADYCPFCPTEEGAEHPTAVPEETYDIAVVENGFPSLKPSLPEPAVEGDGLFETEEAVGACEVVLFTEDHEGVMSEEPASRFRNLVAVWQDRYRSLGEVPEHEYVFVFENKGEEMGVTIGHPHGQIYAYPFVPSLIRRELESSRNHLNKTGRCLFCDVCDAERADGRRVVAENDRFVAFVPYQTRYAYELHVYSKAHLPSLEAFGGDDRRDLRSLLKRVLVAYDSLFGFEMPYVMAQHQKPTREGGEAYSHFHVEFYPPYRTSDKLKYLAGSERGAGTYINNELAKDAATELRTVVPSVDSI